MDHKSTIKKIRSRLSRTGSEAYLFTDRSDIVFLAGFHVHGVIAVITKKEGLHYFIDPMNFALVGKMVCKRKVDLINTGGSLIGALMQFVEKKKIRKISFPPEAVTAGTYFNLCERLKKVSPKVSLVPLKGGKGSISGIVKDIRKIKSPEEIKIIRKAAKETIKIWKSVKRNVEPGMTELEISSMIDCMIRSKGYENSFPTIAAVGKNTGYPHAIPGSKIFRKGEHLLADLGIRINGYCSDLTRTYSKGRINRQIMDFRRFVHKGQDWAIKNIKPGVHINSISRGVNKIFKDNGLGEYILHSLGHGVGLDIHELPFLHDSNEECFKKGMIVTIEPGLYKPGLGGIRKEDMILVTAKGCEVLTV